MKRRSVLLMLLLPACSAPTKPPVDPAVCQQISEFGSYGCADVRGQVLTGGGHPLAGAEVGVMGPVDPTLPVLLNRIYVRTDAAGRYTVRVNRFSPPLGQPDTLSMWVRALVQPPLGVPTPADSVVAVLEFSPVGTRAKVADAPDITIPLP